MREPVREPSGAFPTCNDSLWSRLARFCLALFGRNTPVGRTSAGQHLRESAASFSARGEWHRERGELQQAIACFKSALADDPENPKTLFNLGCCHMPGVVEQAGADLGMNKKELNETAAGFFNRLIDVCEKNGVPLHDPVNVYLNLGIARMSLRDYAAAADCFRKVIELDARNAEAHFKLGRCRRLLGDDEAAIADFVRAVELEPAADNALRDLGDIYRGKENFARAAEYYAQGVALVPDDADLVFKLGVAKGNTGDHEAARAWFTRAVALAPEKAAYHFALWSAERNCQPDKETALADVAEHGGYLTGKGEWVSNKEQQRVADALFHLKEAARLDPYYAYDLAVHYLRQSDYPAAARHYERYHAAAATDGRIDKDEAKKAKKFAAYCRKKIERFGAGEVKS